MLSSHFMLLFASFSHTLFLPYPHESFHTSFLFARFADALPIPEKINLSREPKRSAEITIPLQAFKTKIHRDLPEQTLWGYSSRMPGPTIEVEKDQFLRVHWKNSLPNRHLFPLPKGMDNGFTKGICLPLAPDVRTVTHLHGAEVQEVNPLDHRYNSDGWPDAWTTPGQEQIADYPNHQSARTLWYHDHAMGTTGRNVAAGLAGVYLIHDAYERSLGLPSGQYDIPLIFQSHAINDEGKLEYTPDINQEYYGNTVSVNGKLWPYLSVEPRKYRFRFVNASNARSYALKLLRQEDESEGPAFYQIGSDSGFLEKTELLNQPENPLSPRLILAPGERADIIIDFSHSAGKNFLLHNSSKDDDGEIAIPEIMLFRVAQKLSKPDPSHLPQFMQPITRMKPAEAIATRKIIFAESKTQNGEPMLTLNHKSWNDPIEEKPKLGSTEIWELYNALPDTHPFHIHLVQFQILDRTPLDQNQYEHAGALTLAGSSVAPDPNEMGWKDTVRLNPFTVTRIIMRFLPFAGYYVYHCHILEHEDMDMMRPFQVIQ